ncbi:MAG: hypothetical protein ACD_50C00097G0004 [uncultured bacterium]|nr:MAG: hypothetical protein ACD_50C00097G0004 [uncultured bacterium]
MLKLAVISQDKISSDQKEELHKLLEECFSDVSQQSKQEDFFARGFARLFAY